MKKRNIGILTLTMVLCLSAVLSGCASNATPMEQATNSGDTLSSNSVSAAEATESDKVISSKEQSKTEEIRKAEIAEQYSIYAPYGMTYDTEKDRFFYNGQVVRYFKDQVSAENTNSFFFDDGIVDVEPIRNADSNLTGLRQSSDTDFKARTEKLEKIKLEFETDGITVGSGSFEEGDPNYRDDSLDAYAAFGVSYDQATDNWMYDGKVIHILYDADHNTYCDTGVGDGINLKVLRNQNGNIEKLVKTDEYDLAQYIK